MTRRPSILIKFLISAILAWRSTAYATPPTEEKPSFSLESLFKSVADAVAGVVSPTINEFRSKVSEKKFREAGKFWGENREKLDLTNPHVRELAQQAVAGLNEEIEPGIKSALGEIGKTPRNWPEIATQWPAVISLMANSSSQVAEYDSFRLFSDLQSQSSVYEALRRSLAELQNACIENQWKALERFDFSGRFFGAYPCGRDAEQFLRADASRTGAFVSSASVEKLSGLLREHGSELPTATRAEALSRLMEQHAGSGSTRQPFWTAFASIHSFAKDHPPAALGIHLVVLARSQAAFVRMDGAAEPVATHAISARESSDRRYEVIVVQQDPQVERRITEKGKARGQYINGQETLPNPDWPIAQANFIRAQSEYSSMQLRHSLQRPNGIAGAIIQGAAEGVAAAAVNRAQQQLAQTPQTFTRPTFATYEFDTSSISLTKTAAIDVYLLDRTAGRATKYSMPVEESRTLKMAAGIRDDDTNRVTLKSTYASDSDLEKFEKSMKTLDVRELLAIAAKGTQSSELTFADIGSDIRLAETPVASPGAVAGPPRVDKPIQTVVVAATAKATSVKERASAFVVDDPRMSSVVVVKSSSGSMGSGFYIDEFVVLTNHHVVEGSKLVEIKLRDGREAVGQVFKSDIGADLALVRVTQAGAPVALSSGAVTIGDTVDAIGHPRGLEFSVTRGIVSAMRKLRNPSVPGAPEVLVVQTDSPINPGNSGGPLFLKDTVIGVNTQKMRSGESLGFAVHASEIQKFLARQ